MVNLLDLDARGLADFFQEIGEQPFRARQVLRWLHQVRQSDFEQMTDLSKALRAKLKEHAQVGFPQLVTESAASAPRARVSPERSWLRGATTGANSSHMAPNQLVQIRRRKEATLTPPAPPPSDH